MQQGCLVRWSPLQLPLQECCYGKFSRCDLMNGTGLQGCKWTSRSYRWIQYQPWLRLLLSCLVFNVGTLNRRDNRLSFAASFICFCLSGVKSNTPRPRPLALVLRHLQRKQSELRYKYLKCLHRLGNRLHHRSYHDAFSTSHRISCIARILVRPLSVPMFIQAW